MERGGYDNAFSIGEVGIWMSVSQVTLELFLRNWFGVAIRSVIDTTYLLECEEKCVNRFANDYRTAIDPH